MLPDDHALDLTAGREAGLVFEYKGFAFVSPGIPVFEEDWNFPLSWLDWLEGLGGLPFVWFRPNGRNGALGGACSCTIL